MADWESAFDAVVLAGGTGQRMREENYVEGRGADTDPTPNVDKLSLAVGDATLLDRALAAVGGAKTIVVVGPRRPTAAGSAREAELIWTREDPPGSGPASAILHALTLAKQPLVVVVAGDMPFATTAVPRLLTAIAGHDAAMLVDDGGRRQPLIAAYVADALRARGDEHDWANRSVRSLVAGLDIVDVAAAPNEALDCDAPDDLARAREVAASQEAASL